MKYYINVISDTEFYIGVEFRYDSNAPIIEKINDNIEIVFNQPLDNIKEIVNFFHFKNANKWIMNTVKDYFEQLPDDHEWTTKIFKDFLNDIKHYIEFPNFNFQTYLGTFGEIIYYYYIKKNNISEKYQSTDINLIDFQFSEIKTFTCFPAKISTNYRQYSYIRDKRNKAKYVFVKLDKVSGNNTLIELLSLDLFKNDVHLNSLKIMYNEIYKIDENKKIIDSYTVDINNINKYLYMLKEQIPSNLVQKNVDYVDEVKFSFTIKEDMVKNFN